MNNLESGLVTDQERISTTETGTKEAETADVIVTGPVIEERETAVTVTGGGIVLQGIMTETAVERGSGITKEVNMSMRVVVGPVTEMQSTTETNVTSQKRLVATTKTIKGILTGTAIATIKWRKMTTDMNASTSGLRDQSRVSMLVDDPRMFKILKLENIFVYLSIKLDAFLFVTVELDCYLLLCTDIICLRIIN